MRKIALIKIGGGLITDKSKPYTIRDDMMGTAAIALRNAIRANPGTVFVVGNGAGSFGHFVASNRKPGISDKEHVRNIHESVVQLNTVFVQKLIEQGIPASSVSPASSFTCANGAITHASLNPIKTLLKNNRVPVIFGDIVPDTTRGGTILSTETLLEYIAEKLQSEFGEVYVVYVGNTDGVLDENGGPISELSETMWKEIKNNVRQVSGFDVTGGMRHKVESAFRMARVAKQVYIISGKDPDTLSKVLGGERTGTHIIV